MKRGHLQLQKITGYLKTKCLRSRKHPPWLGGRGAPPRRVGVPPRPHSGGESFGSFRMRGAGIKRRILEVQLTSAPWLRRRRTMARRPEVADKCKEVHPLYEITYLRGGTGGEGGTRSRASTEQPCSSRDWAMARWPSLAASKRGVTPD